MHDDERKIRELVERWMAATKSGDLATVLSLMAEDVVFMVPGQEPFGRDRFAANSSKMKEVRFDGSSDIQELEVLGDWAWMRNRLKVMITRPNGQSVTHSGYTLTVLRKQPEGNWVIARDANLLVPEK